MDTNTPSLSLGKAADEAGFTCSFGVAAPSPSGNPHPTTAVVAVVSALKN